MNDFPTIRKSEKYQITIQRQFIKEVLLDRENDDRKCWKNNYIPGYKTFLSQNFDTFT